MIEGKANNTGGTGEDRGAGSAKRMVTGSETVQNAESARKIAIGPRTVPKTSRIKQTEAGETESREDGPWANSQQLRIREVKIF